MSIIEGSQYFLERIRYREHQWIPEVDVVGDVDVDLKVLRKEDMTHDSNDVNFACVTLDSPVVCT